MQLTIKQEHLNPILNNLTKATAPRSPSPALRGVLLETDENELVLNASDGDLSWRAWSPVRVGQPGKILLPADSLSDLVRRLEPGELELAEDTQEEGSGVIIRWHGGETKIWAMDHDLYPPLLEESAQGISFYGEELRRAMSKVLPAASREEAPSKAIVRGVHVTLNEGKPRWEATDGVRLAVLDAQESPSTPSPSALDMVIPLRLVTEFARFSGREGEVILSEDENNLFASWQDGELRYLLVCRRVTGRYPDTRDYLPKEYICRISVPTAAFAAAVERAMVINRLDSQTYPVKLRVDPEGNRLMVTASSSSVGTHKEYLNLDHWEGKPLELAFNGRYLLDGLRTIEGTNTVFESSGVGAPARITGENSHFFYLLLPLRLG